MDLRPLPDIVKKNLKILFVGISPGERSSKAQHYFAGRSNVFWRLLFESRLTDRLLKSDDDGCMLDYDYGLTDIVKKPTSGAVNIKRQSTAKNRNRLDRLLNANSPKILAFVGKMGFRAYSGNFASSLEYGFQHRHIGTIVYLLPSTSGQSYADTSYDEKLEWYRNIRDYSSRIR